METPNKKQPERDMEASPFAKILANLDDVCPNLELAVFYDSGGETIDYHSYIDPYETRIVAAHIGCIATSVIRKFKKLNLGLLQNFEMWADKKESVTISLGDNLFLTIVFKAGNLNA